MIPLPSLWQCLQISFYSTSLLSVVVAFQLIRLCRGGNYSQPLGVTFNTPEIHALAQTATRWDPPPERIDAIVRLRPTAETLAHRDA